MFANKECIAMLLAGGRGTRLGALTQFYPKPAVSFGGGHRIIDFVLNNCLNSDIHTIGILSQYQTHHLEKYIRSLIPDGDGMMDISMLPPETVNYSGTADAVYQNIEFIDTYAPENVFVLASDHVYEMDYKKMMSHHIKTGADVTIAAMPVDWEEISRFGIITADDSMVITQFDEKPVQADSNLASMGIYVFKWQVLRKYLLKDQNTLGSAHDFGRDIIPSMLFHDEKMVVYPFEGYWRDVGTVESLWQANMDFLNGVFKMSKDKWSIYSSDVPTEPTFISKNAKVHDSIVHCGDRILGDVYSSIISDSVIIEEGSEIRNSVIMSNAYIGKGVKIDRAIIDCGTLVMDDVTIGPGTGLPPEVFHEKGVWLISSNSPSREAVNDKAVSRKRVAAR